MDDAHSGERHAFVRELRLVGVPGSRWGFDPDLGCFWAEAGGVRLGPEELLVTVPSLARALAVRLGMGEDDAYLALTA